MQTHKHNPLSAQNVFQKKKLDIHLFYYVIKQDYIYNVMEILIKNDQNPYSSQPMRTLDENILPSKTSSNCFDHEG